MKSLFSKDFKAIFRNLVLYQLDSIFISLINLPKIYLTPSLLGKLKIKPKKLLNSFIFPIFNPSIVSFKNKIYFISRCNKPYKNKKKYDYRSINFIHQCNNNFKLLKITKLDDTLLKKKLKIGFNGIEDIRLFLWRNSLWGIGASIYYEDSSNYKFQRNYSCNQTLIKIKDNKIIDFYDLQSPFNKDKEKNWTPVVKNKQLFFIYSIKPLIVFKFNNGKLESQKFKSNDNYNQIFIRGGTTTVKLPNGQILGVGHKAALVSFGFYFYKHLFYILDDKFNIKMLSKEFYIQKRGSEFPTGLILNGKNIIMSYGSFKQNTSMYCKISLHKLKFFNINI